MIRRAHFKLNALLMAATLHACASAPEQVAKGCPAEANLLRAIDFTARDEAGNRVWRTAQHSRNRSFESEVSAGSLIVRRTGKEPWFTYTQRVEGDFVAGAELQYDALLTLNTSEPQSAHNFGYLSGLYLVGYQTGGRRAAFRSMADHSPNLGVHPEQRVVVTVTSKEVLDGLSAGFIHQAAGSFTVRNPRLINLSDYPECRLP